MPLNMLLTFRLYLAPVQGSSPPQFHVVFDDHFTTTQSLLQDVVPPNWTQLFNDTRYNAIAPDVVSEPFAPLGREWADLLAELAPHDIRHPPHSEGAKLRHTPHSEGDTLKHIAVPEGGNDLSTPLLPHPNQSELHTRTRPHTLRQNPRPTTRHTKEQFADIFTKPLPGPAFTYLRKLLLGWDTASNFSLRAQRECCATEIAHNPRTDIAHKPRLLSCDSRQTAHYPDVGQLEKSNNIEKRIVFKNS